MQNTAVSTHCSAATLRRRRPRRAIGEVSISSASIVYVNNAPAPAANEDVEPVYENATITDACADKPLPPRRRNRSAAAADGHVDPSIVFTAANPTKVRRNYSVVFRQLDRAPTNEAVSSEAVSSESVAMETQHITIFIGED